MGIFEPDERHRRQHGQRPLGRIGREAPLIRPRAVVVHCLADARAAMAAAAGLGRPLTLLSAPGAAGSLGALGFAALIREAAAAYPDVPLTAILDCADEPGLALNALRHGIRHIRLEASGDALAKVADMAGQVGASLDTTDWDVLDLLDVRDAESMCRAWLSVTDER